MAPEMVCPICDDRVTVLTGAQRKVEERRISDVESGSRG
jgi:uncharacterized Zn finger protein (UPF0148 family)